MIIIIIIKQCTTGFKNIQKLQVATAQDSRDATQSNGSEEIDRKTSVTRIVAWKDSFKILSKEPVKGRKTFDCRMNYSEMNESVELVWCKIPSIAQCPPTVGSS